MNSVSRETIKDINEIVRLLGLTDVAIKIGIRAALADMVRRPEIAAEIGWPEIVEVAGGR